MPTALFLLVTFYHATSNRLFVNTTFHKNLQHDVNATKRLKMWNMFICGEYDQKLKSNKFNDEVKGINPCCLKHDQCELDIQDGYTRWGLANTVGYKVMWCKCDIAFMECLKDNGGKEARAIGNLYFNVRKTPCFMLEPGAKKSQLQRRKGKKTLNGYDMESSINFNGKDGYDLQKRQQTLAHFVEPPPFTMKPNQEFNTAANSALMAWRVMSDFFKNNFVQQSGPVHESVEMKKKKKIVKLLRR